MNKKIVAMLLSVTMTMNLCACGGDTKETADTTGPAAETADASSAADDKAGEDTGASSGSGEATTLNFWGWGYEWSDYTDKFEECYPEEGITFNQVNLNWDAYQTTLDVSLQEGAGADQYPDLFGAEVAFCKKYIESDYSMDLAELWGSEEALMDAIENAGISDFLVETARSSDGKIKGLCFQQTGCVLAYRRSLAKEYLGTDDPKEVYEQYCKDPETFVETCKMVAEKSGGAVVGISSLDEVYMGYQQYLTQEPIKDNVIDISDAALMAIQDMKDLYDAGASNDTVVESEPYIAEINGTGATQTLFTQGPPWHLKLRLLANMGDTYGDWAVTNSPYLYSQGGTWLCVGKDTQHPEECKRFLEYWGLDTSEKGLGQLCIDNGDCAASAATVARVAETGFAMEAFGGQDILTTISEAAGMINGDSPTVKYISNELSTCREGWYRAAQAWINGEVGSLEEAVDFYIEYVQATYPDAVGPDNVSEIVADFLAAR